MAKSFKQLCFTDNFMFCKVMTTNPELCRHLLELILGTGIRRVKIHSEEKAIKMTKDTKGIRLDVYLDDSEGTVYDLEMQTKEKRSLPRRMRYYQGIMDLNRIEEGADYVKLPKSVVLFICTFDFFDRGLPIYIFENRCEAEPELLMGDDTLKIFVNPYGDTTGLSEGTANLLRYIRTQEVSDTFTAELECAVERVRAKKEWEVEYMNWRAYEMDMNIEKEEAREEGLAQGLAQGMAQGLTQGMAQGLTQGIAQGRTEGIAQGMTQGIAQGLQAMVCTLKGILPTCDDVYEAVIRNEVYADVTRQQVEHFYQYK